MRGSAMSMAPAPAPAMMDNTMAADVAEAGSGRRLTQVKTKTVSGGAGGRLAVAPAGAVTGKVRPLYALLAFVLPYQVCMR